MRPTFNPRTRVSDGGSPPLCWIAAGDALAMAREARSRACVGSLRPATSKLSRRSGGPAVSSGAGRGRLGGGVGGRNFGRDAATAGSRLAGRLTGAEVVGSGAASGSGAPAGRSSTISRSGLVSCDAVKSTGAAWSNTTRMTPGCHCATRICLSSRSPTGTVVMPRRCSRTCAPVISKNRRSGFVARSAW